VRKTSFIDNLSIKFRNRFGDFVWYSLLLFIVLRICDLVNAFIGIWLVPRYVQQSELGAVLPLLQLSSLFGLPISVLVLTFKKFINQYQVVGDLGKLKSMLRSFLISSIAMFFVGVMSASLVMPLFFERIRIAKGSLGTLIIATAILSTVSPVFMDSLQSLKKFKAITIIHFFSAPLRLLVMLITMPIRALSGYMLGQAAPPLFQICAAWWALKKDFGTKVKAVAFWSDDKPRILKYMMGNFIFLSVATVTSTVFMTVLRQRLPDVESAAYYMISRFAELGTYVGLTVSYVMFPYVAEHHATGTEDSSIVWKASLSTLLFGCVCSVFFWLCGDKIFSLTSLWSPYIPYVNDLALLCLALSFIATLGCLNNYEVAMSRFSFMFITAPVLILQSLIAVCFSGYEFFRGKLPDFVVDWIAGCNFATLRNMILFMLICNVIMTVGCALLTYCNSKQGTGNV
jgi:O-antigen/teichoic acid export membrane protein